MRISYTEDEDFAGQFDLWQANCRRSLAGKAGQRELRELREALLALPDKRLAGGVLEDHEGTPCAIGAYAKRKGVDLAEADPDYESDEVGIAVGMPRLVAWKVVEQNDVELRNVTPEVRYELMLAWVNGLLAQ